MSKYLLCLLCVVALPLCATAIAYSAEAEDVTVLPQDAGKLYLSVVGNPNDAKYREVLGWFESNADLGKLKAKVHFCPVTSDTATYAERYAGNVKGLPTVRLQKPDGTVMYEASGTKLPKTASLLHKALSRALHKVFGIFRSIFRCPDKCCPDKQNPAPVQPEPQPAPVEPEPAVVAEDEEASVGLIIGLAIACAVVGGLGGVAVQWKKTYAKM